MKNVRTDGTYVAALWEHPDLCLALFGIHFATEEAERLYAEAGIGPEVDASLADAEGLLLNRPMMSDDGSLLLQYWRSHADLDRFARRMPHARWWKWLMRHADRGLGFYHEIYLVKGGEAIYEPGTPPIGPARFCTTEPVKAGEGRSRERLRRFEAASAERAPARR